MKLFLCNLVGILLVGFCVSCGSNSEKVCAPGSTQACLCGPDTKGVQTCIAGGMAWGTCICDNSNNNSNNNKSICEQTAGDLAGTYTFRFSLKNTDSQSFEIVIVILKDGTVTIAEPPKNSGPDTVKCDTSKSTLCDFKMTCESYVKERLITSWRVNFQRLGQALTFQGGFCDLSVKDLMGTFTWKLDEFEHNRGSSIDFDVKSPTQLTAKATSGVDITCEVLEPKLCGLKLLCKDNSKSFYGGNEMQITFTKQ